MFRTTISTIAVLAALSPAFAGSQTPSAAVQTYVKTVAAATSWDQITPLMSTEVIGEMKSISADEMKGLLGFFTGIRAEQKNFRIVSEEINGDKATVQTAGCLDGDTFEETINLANEGGAWKVGKARMKQDGSKC